MTTPTGGAPSAGAAAGGGSAGGTGGAGGPTGGAGGSAAPPAPGPGAGGPGGGPGAGPPPPGGGDRPGAGGAPQGGGPDPAPAGAGPEASRATGQLGQGSMRHGHLQNAFANVQGDVVGGNKYVLIDGGRKEPRVLSPLIDERVRHAYHEPAEFGAAREALLRQKVVILRGAPGYGKSALAVRLLQGACEGPIHHLDSKVALAALADSLENGAGGIEAGVGFLLDQPADIGNLSGEVYEKVQGALSHANAWMVLTVASTEVADSELLAGVLDLREAPDTLAVARAHVRWHLGARHADRLLARTDVNELLGELLAGDPACRQAAELGAVLADDYEETGEVNLQRIRESRVRLADEDFEIWLEGLPDRSTRCFALALAVLNGLPQENIAQAARALEHLLDDKAPYVRAPGSDGRLPHAHDPFAQPRRRRLARLRAHTVGKRRQAGRTVQRDRGEPGDALEYKDPGYPPRVIRHAWNQYGVQAELLEWLTTLVNDPSEQVRIYAAASLGVIATESYTYVCDHLLYEWALSEDANYRDAVAYALSVGCEDPWVKEQATVLAEVWLVDRSEPMAQATAARVHGMGVVGDRSEQELGRLAVVDNWTVAVAVGSSFTDLLTADHERAEKVLQVLRAGSAKHQARPTALLAFLIVCSQWIVDSREWETGGVVPAWPALLYHAHRRESLRDAYVGLWRDALNHTFLRELAQQVLGDWAAQAEKDTQLRAMFLLMIGAIAYQDPRSGRTLRRFAEDWTAPENLAPLPVVAAAVHAQLDQEHV